MKRKMKIVYTAHSMTNGHQNLDKVNTLISWLRKERYKVAQPSYVLFPDLLASGALESIKQSDIVIADVTVYSHGVGFELGYAYALKKDIIVISSISAKNKVSKFLLGLFPEIIFYYDGNDLITEVSHRLNRFCNKKRQ